MRKERGKSRINFHLGLYLFTADLSFTARLFRDAVSAAELKMADGKV
jgi:hypothetical protein